MKGLKAACIHREASLSHSVIRRQEATENQRSVYFFSAAFPNVNPPGLGPPNPNAAGVVLFCPCPGPGAPKLNGDPVPNPVDGEGVTGVNVNADSLESLAPFVMLETVVVSGVLETPKEDMGLFVAGIGAGCVVGNALTGADVIPNALPFANGLGPGLEASCLGAPNGNTPGEIPVVAGVLGPEDGKVTFGSDPPAGLLAAKLKRG